MLYVCNSVLWCVDADEANEIAILEGNDVAEEACQNVDEIAQVDDDLLPVVEAEKEAIGLQITSYKSYLEISIHQIIIILFLFSTILHLYNTCAAVELVYHLVQHPDGDSDYTSDCDSSNDDADEVFHRLAKY